MINTIEKYSNLFGCCQNHILFIKQFLKPLTKYVTGLNISAFLSHTIFTVSGFHIIPESQNTAETNDFTKLAKSLLMAASNEENNAHTVQNKNVKPKKNIICKSTNDGSDYS